MTSFYKLIFESSFRFHLIRRACKRVVFILLCFMVSYTICAQTEVPTKLYPVKNEKTKMYGFKNMYGTILHPYIYEDVWGSGDCYSVKKDGLWGMVCYNKVLIECKYDWVYSESGRYIRVLKNNLHGMIDVVNGKEVVSCIYEDSKYPDDNGFMAVKKKGLWGIVDYRGNLYLKCEYESLGDGSNVTKIHLNDHIIAKKATGWGIVSNLGKIILPFKYEYISSYANHCLEIKENGLYGIYDLARDKILIPTLYNSIHTFGEGFYSDNSIFNKAGNVIYSNPNTEILRRGGKDIIILKNENSLQAIYNLKKQKIVTQFLYQKFSNYNEGSIGAERNGKYGVLDADGNEILPFVYEYADGFYDGMSIFMENGKYGYVNRMGVKIVPAKYARAMNFTHDLGVVAMLEIKTTTSLGYKYYGCVNNDGKEIVPCIYSWVSIQDDGEYIYVNDEDKVGYYNRNGDLIVSPTHKDSAQILFDCYKADNVPCDVDTNIPFVQNKSDKIFVVIISNEKYSEANITDVQYANNDGKIFAEYCKKTLGVPADNIHVRENATLNQIRSEVNWLKDISEAYSGKAKIIFYYAGHGIPDESNSTSYILPSDGMGNDARSAYSVSELYAELGKLPAEQVTVFMDACFSGAKRDGKMLSDARAVAIVAKPSTPQGNMVVFSAAQGDETAYQYKKKKHGMFTYFLLKKLQETKGDVTLDELGRYITEQVKQHSIRENGKLQTPTMQVAPNIADVNSIKLY